MKSKESDSIFLKHLPCPNCGSSDANSLYSDGHEHCFSCGRTSKGEEMTWIADDNGVIFVDGSFRPLKARGISEDCCRKFGYTVGEFKREKCHIAPYYINRKMVAQHLRFDNKAFSWVGSPKGVELFGQHLWGQGGKRLVITEGEIDALTIAQAFNLSWPVVSIPNGVKSAYKYLSAQIEWLESFEEVVLGFDDDEPGREAVEEVAPLFSPGKLKIMRYNGKKDANELIMSGGTYSELGKCVFQAKAYHPAGIVDFHDLIDELLEGPEQGLSIPFPSLQDMTKGIRKGELLLMTAGSGIGKSTLAHEIGFHLRTVHKKKLGILALEENPKRTLERYVGMQLNRPIHFDREGLTREQLTEAWMEVIDGERGNITALKHFGSTALDVLLSKIRFMVLGYGAEYIILDHISIVVSGLNEIGESERKTIDVLMTRLRQLVEELHFSLIAIVHLKRPGEGKSFNEGRRVSLTDLRGSASLEQLSDIVLALERNQQDSKEGNLAHIRVLKNRPIGLVGEADTLEYVNKTGRLQVKESYSLAPVNTSPETDAIF